MANFFDWSTTASANDDAGTPINWAENQLPATVNNSAREMMKQTADWRNFVGGLKISATADTMTLTSGLTLTAYAQDLTFAFECGAANTGAATINIDSVGAKSIVKFHDVALAAGDLEAGGKYVLSYEATADNFQLLSPSSIAPATLTGVETFTNKSIDLANNTITGTTAEFNTALSDGSFTTLAGSEVLTNKTLTSVILNVGLSGTAIDTDATMAADSDTLVPSQKAVKALYAGLPGSGTVTSVATGGIATGGPITSSGTVTVTKATGAEIDTGTNDTNAATPKAIADSGLFINPMTTQGDMVRGGASGVPERFAIGTTGQVLTSDGTDAAFADASGGVGDVVGTQAVSGVTAVQFTTFDTSIMRHSIAFALDPDADFNVTGLLVSTNAGSSYLTASGTYKFHAEGYTDTSDTQTNKNSGGFGTTGGVIFHASGDPGGGAGEVGGGVIELVRMGGTFEMAFSSFYNYIDKTGVLRFNRCNGIIYSTAAINAVKIVDTSGAAFSGTFTLDSYSA